MAANSRRRCLGRTLTHFPCFGATDALVQDPEFKKTSALYAADQDKFFEDFSAVFKKLIELGVPANQFSKELKLAKTE